MVKPEGDGSFKNSLISNAWRGNFDWRELHLIILEIALSLYYYYYYLLLLFFWGGWCWGGGGGGRGGRKELHLIILEGSFSFIGVCNYVNVGYPYPYFLIGF